MFEFLTGPEINLIRNDYQKLLNSPEGQDITIEYRTWLNASQTAIDDPVYEEDGRAMDPVPVTVTPVRAIQVVIKKDWELKKYPQFLVEVGDSIFFFHYDQNLHQPINGKEVIRNTMVFIDPSGVRWKPRQQIGGPIKKNQFVRIGQDLFSQPVSCFIEQ